MGASERNLASAFFLGRCAMQIGAVVKGTERNWSQAIDAATLILASVKLGYIIKRDWGLEIHSGSRCKLPK